jgi:hypothetical protein
MFLPFFLKKNLENLHSQQPKNAAKTLDFTGQLAPKHLAFSSKTQYI